MKTIADVAKEAGVSKTTVSRILNQRGNFSDETIQNVLSAVKKLGYRPNEVARALGKNKSQTIALILPTIHIPAFVELQSSLEELLYAKGYKILLYGSLFNREKEEITLQMLKNNMIDGIILGSFTEDMSHFIQSSLPIVSTGRKIAPHIPVVKTNGIHGGILAAKHLMGKKCKKVLYITTYPGDLEKEDERFNGFKSVLLEKEIQFWTYQISINEQIHNDFTPMITQMLLEHPDADGIFAETDLLAMSCIQTCCRLGYAVPKDIKIVGYGNHYFSSLTNPALTTVDSDKLLEAQEIVNLLLSMIETDCINVKDVIIPVSLIERQST